MDPLTMGLLSGGIQLASGLLSGLIPQSGRHARMQMMINWQNAENQRLAQEENDRRVAEYNERALKLAEQVNNTPQTSEGDVDLGRLVTDAKNAGFNPLSVLRAGGLSLYARSKVMGHNALGAAQMALGQVNRYEPIVLADAPKRTRPQIGEVIGSALSAAGSAFFSQYNATQNLGVKRQALEAQVSALSQKRGGGLMRAVAGEQTGYQKSRGIVSVKLGGDVDDKRDDGPGKTMNPYPDGTGLTPDPRRGKQEDIETSLGDAPGELYGVIGLALDVYRNVMGKNAFQRTYDAKRMQREDVGVPYGQRGFKRGFQDRPVSDTLPEYKIASYRRTIANGLFQNLEGNLYKGARTQAPFDPNRFTAITEY